MNDWYANLQRPALTPPDWVFGPVWTVLYIMIAVSIVLFVKKKETGSSRSIYILIILHLMSNFAWTGLFFGLQNPGLALIDIIFLDLSLLGMIYYFWKVSPVSSLLLCPYLVWVLFATYLNLSFYLLNRT